MGKAKRLKQVRITAEANREADRQRRRTEPVTAQVLCPVTNKYVDSGVSMDVASFHGNNTFTNMKFRCSSCGQMHTWNGDDIVLNA